MQVVIAVVNSTSFAVNLSMQVYSSDQIPDAYKQGWVIFFGMQFVVTQDVLIPRPETEMIIEEVKNFLDQNQIVNSSIIDVGTGSGAIAITLGKLFPETDITAIDLSENALGVARKNADDHGVKNIEFKKNDLLSNVIKTPDIIVANLPYIPHSRLPELDSSVIDFEPVLALDGGSDGFDLYRRMFSQIISQNLEPKIIICEIDDTHGKTASDEAKKRFPLAKITVKKDFAGLDRLLVVLN